MAIKTDAASLSGSAKEDPGRTADLGSARKENPGSTPVPGVGESVPLSRTSDERSFRRDAETHAAPRCRLRAGSRDGRAPQNAREARALPKPPLSSRKDNAEGLPASEVDL